MEVEGNFRVRASTRTTQNQIIDSRGTHFSTHLTVTCGQDVDVLIEWFDPATKLPASGQKWDDSLQPIRSTKCKYTGWSAEGSSRIKIGGPASDDPEAMKASSSAWNNHNLQPMEWFTCEDLVQEGSAGGKASTKDLLLALLLRGGA